MQPYSPGEPLILLISVIVYVRKYLSPSLVPPVMLADGPSKVPSHERIPDPEMFQFRFQKRLLADYQTETVVPNSLRLRDAPDSLRGRMNTVSEP